MSGFFARAWLVLPLYAVAGRGQPAAAERASLPVLTRVEQIVRLTPDQAKLGYPVHLRAVVTYCHHDELFVQDATAGIYVEPTQNRPALHPGDYIELRGITKFSDFTSAVDKAQFRILGTAQMPAPRKVSGAELASGKADSQWIEVKGVVRSAVGYDGGLMLDVTSGAFQYKAFIPNVGTVPEELVDASIRMRGACGGLFNRKDQFIALKVLVPGLAGIHVEQPAPGNLFSLPTRPIRTFLGFDPHGAFGHRVRVQGAVTLQRLGRSLFICDEKEGLLVKTRQRTSIRVGDRVDVVGFPAPGEYAPILQDAIFRRIAAGPAPNPVPVTAGQALLGDYDAELVRISARLLDSSLQPGQQSLVLQAGKVSFRAEIEEGAGQQTLARLRNGSLLQLTGICSVQVDENREPRGFLLLLRSGQDIVVLERPSWWTVDRALAVLGSAGVMILAVLGWTVRVERQSRERDAAWLHFTVRDTGIGVPPEKQASIFEPFTQADGATARRYGGTGLGLTISKRMVELMGGCLWVESAVGEGSTFHFTARLGVGSHMAQPEPAEQASLAGLPVLVVDDNLTSRRILEDMLLGWRMKTTLADSGAAALKYLEQALETGRPFPLVLTDAHMPEMDGFALAEKIQQNPGLAGATIMMLTSASQRGDAARCRELGVAGYLTKPVGPSELWEAILLVLGSKSRAAGQAPLVTRHSLGGGTEDAAHSAGGR